ncbi:hypothetical protein FPQ18DRAFT_327961 [Pyronema domesticum]|nr:hypothetical protein FPQ18DRAFT_327961 [Pyronema domesticum]
MITIDEAARARKQGASIKRLTWITFAFLPLLFIAYPQRSETVIRLHCKNFPQNQDF